MEFTVDRSKWRCGGNGPNQNGVGETQLLNDQGYMCCLGFVAKQLGAQQTDIYKVECPQYVPRFIGNILVDDDGMDSLLTNRAMSINDFPSTSKEQKEQHLIQLFAEEGNSIKFIGEYPHG